MRIACDTAHITSVVKLWRNSLLHIKSIKFNQPKLDIFSNINISNDIIFFWFGLVWFGFFVLGYFNAKAILLEEQ